MREQESSWSTTASGDRKNGREGRVNRGRVRGEREKEARELATQTY